MAAASRYNPTIMQQRCALLFAVVALIVGGGCSNSVKEEPTQRACNGRRGILRVEDVLSNDDACRNWVEMVYGRAVQVRSGAGSGAVWSRRTRYGTGLVVTAAHVLTPCTPDTECPEALRNPKRESGAADFRLTEVGGVFASRRTAHFPIFNLATPRTESGSPQILPRHDVTIYGVDAQQFETRGYQGAVQPAPMSDAPVDVHDPNDLTEFSPTWAAAQPEVDALIVGYALDEPAGWPIRLLASVGRVLSDADAFKTIETLKTAHDEEGSIPYDPAVEFLLEGHARAGMSGSGVFDTWGRQVGVLVRGSSAEVGAHYLRAVRMSYIVGRLNAAFDALPSEDAAAIGPYIER